MRHQEKAKDHLLEKIMILKIPFLCNMKLVHNINITLRQSHMKFSGISFEYFYLNYYLQEKILFIALKINKYLIHWQFRDNNLPPRHALAYYYRISDWSDRTLILSGLVAT
jgi:hypothetical protein